GRGGLGLDAVAVGVVLVLDDGAVGLLDLGQAVLVVPRVDRFRVLGGEVAVVVPGVGLGAFERQAVAIVVAVADRSGLEHWTGRARGAKGCRLGLSVADGVVAARLFVDEADRLRDLLAGQAIERVVGVAPDRAIVLGDLRAVATRAQREGVALDGPRERRDRRA